MAFVCLNKLHVMLCYESSVGRDVRGAKRPYGKTSMGWNVVPWGEVSVGQKVHKSSQFSRRERNRAQQEFFCTWNKTCILAHNTCVCHVRYNNCGNKH